MENYFNYFTEIEEHFQRRRGRIYLSPLDWALIETWKDAGVPLQAALRGIDAAFDKQEQRQSKSQKVNSLAYCAQEVLAAAEDMKEAAVGARREKPNAAPGLEAETITRFFLENGRKLREIQSPAALRLVAVECADTLTDLASSFSSAATQPRLEDLERRLTVMEEKLLAALTMTTSENDLFGLRTEADREIAPYRSKMPGAQIQQLQKQFMHKRLFEKAKIPRLSLFYL